MNSKLCVCLDFLREKHKAQITAAAEAAGFDPHFFTPEELPAAKACLQDCQVLYAADPELLRAAPRALQWYCCANAGVEPYCKNDGIFANPDCLLTNSSGAYGVAIAEHLLMVALMLLRRMPDYQQSMAAHVWPEHLPVRSILGSEITVLGAGDIGTAFAHRAKALGAARLTGVSRSGRARDPVYDRMVSFDRLDEILPETHLLVMALPSTPETAGILSRERLALLPADALVINVGRGTAIDQDALMDALNSEKLAGAALDVMVPEPLPADHPLWETKNLILTPHISGNQTLSYTRDKGVEQFCENLGRYAAGQPLKHVVDRTRGY